jgi:hypothetical protein
MRSFEAWQGECLHSSCPSNLALHNKLLRNLQCLRWHRSVLPIDVAEALVVLHKAVHYEIQ